MYWCSAAVRACVGVTADVCVCSSVFEGTLFVNYYWTYQHRGHCWAEPSLKIMEITTDWVLRVQRCECTGTVT